MKPLNTNLNAPTSYNIKVISDKINEILKELDEKGIIKLEVQEDEQTIDKEYE
jgi:hypothetical protein